MNKDIQDSTFKPSKDKLQNLKSFLSTVITDKVALKDYKVAIDAGILALSIAEQLKPKE
tara:strand:+ start:3582 stop:3758 length:177 start_codon:yes stop_codon:yes gene_type:complete